ncbi:MAG: GEVED domain-containing protein, partial [Cruoricaptor ignavus]|nr:GEVED domain-containing protein [Cruoricaptor ignavus]
QQTNYETQKITVGDDGPFKMNLTSGENLFAGVENTLSWDVANTNNAPYNVSEVAISYTSDDGNTWNELSASAPNNGSFSFIMPVSLNGQQLQFRVEALGNVFYAISPKANVVSPNSCTVIIPQNLSVSEISYNTAQISWDEILTIQIYILQYRKSGETIFNEINTTTNTFLLTALESGISYEFRVKSVCPNSQSDFSDWFTFSTLSLGNCTSSSNDGSREYIQKVEIERFSKNSGASEYSDFMKDSIKYFYLNKNTKPLSIRVTPKWENEILPISIAAWIDFDGDLVFSDDEQILSVSGTTEKEVISEFEIPANALVNANGVKMRVSLKSGSEIPTACEHFAYGEVEDYTVIIQDTTLQYGENTIVYPNPFLDIINTTNVKNGTKYQLYDMSGRLTKQGIILLNKIDLPNLTPAVYILKIEGKEPIKIIKD